MRALLKIISVLFVVGALAAAAGLFWGMQQYMMAGPLQETKLVMVDRGQGVASIAGKLSGEKIISNPLLFRIAARLSGTDKKLQAGEYEFAAGISMQDIIAKLQAGDIYKRQFSIPEGLTSWQIVQILNNAEELSGEIKDIPKEGSLLPETYSYLKDDTRQGKIEQMQKAMDDVLHDLWLAKPNDAPVLSKGEVIILASIVEKETAVPDERKRIAGVFINRLKKGMKLQTDPTVIYAITGGKIQNEGKGPLGRRLLTKDLQFESPYNTYKYAGLPPGPIANPGKASIEAVLNPEKHEFYYFVADGTGGHVFSKTLADHNANVAKWRKIRAKN